MLKEWLDRYEIHISDEELLLLKTHLDYVLETNKSIRLTAIHSKEEGERLHILDSLLILPEVLSAPEGRMLDIGTGGGFPGFPIALISNRSVDLLDSVKKKAKAIEEFIHKYYVGDLEMSAIGLRAEELALERSAYYSIILARAVSSLPALVELASPLLIEGGHLIAHKGPNDDEELERAMKVAEIVGMKFLARREYELPEGNEQRTVYVFVKAAEPNIELPRRPGRAQRKPLA